MNNKDSAFSHKLFVLFIAAIAFIQFTSFLPNEVRLLSLLIVCFFCIIDRRITQGSKNVGMLLFFFAISFFYVFLLGRGHFNELRNIALPYTMMFTCMFIAPHILRLNSKEINIIYYTFGIGLLITLIATVVIVRINPNAVRTLGFGNAEGEAENALASFYSRAGLITYSMAHILPTIACALTVQAIELQKKYKKIVFGIIVLLTLYVMYSATITTALLVSVLSILLIFTYDMAKGNTRRFVVLSVTAVVLVFATGGLTGLLTEALQGSNNAINEKFQDIITSIESGRATGQLEGREDHWQLTFDAISKDPFFGGASGPTDTGRHILFFDYWAWYGFFCLLLFVSWWREVKSLKRILNKEMWGKYLLCLLPVIIMVFSKGPHFLPAYFFVTLLVLRVCFMKTVFTKGIR